jgi:hypothetical protein
MSKPISVAFTFQTQTGPIPLSQLDTDISAVYTAVNDFGTYGNYVADTSGGANVITVTTPAGTTFSYTAGTPIQVLLANTNTSGTVVINVNGLGAQGVKNIDGSNPAVGQLIAGMILDLQYNGTVFLLTGAASKAAAAPIAFTRVATHKTANTNFTSTSLAADPDLQLPLPIGTFAISMFIQMLGGASNSGFKLQLNPSSGTMTGTYGQSGSANGTTVPPPQGQTNIAATQVVLTAINTTAVDYLVITGQVVVTVAGTLNFNFASNGGASPSVTVLSGSWMKAESV